MTSPTTRAPNPTGSESDGAAGETTPLVSVLTIFYNRAELVAASLGSILDQTYPHLEIIAVDDGSTDDTLAEMRKFEDDRLRIVAKANSGFTDSMCLAASMANGSLIAVHDAGDISLPERITRQVAAMRDDPSVGVVACKVLNPVLGTTATKIVGRENGLDFHQRLMERNMFTHGEVMYRKALYDRVGGYRRFFRFAQDLDLWLRMSRFAGYHTVQDILYERIEIAGSVSATAEKTLAQQRFSELARQSVERVSAGGADLVDSFGEDALRHLRKSARLANKLARIALRFALRSKDLDGAKLIATAAVHAKATPRAVAAYTTVMGLRGMTSLTGRS